MALVLISVAIMQQTPRIHIRHIVTIPASIVAFTQLTDSVTLVQAISHSKCAKRFQTVTLTSTATPATITAVRSRSCADVSSPIILHLPEKRVHYSVECTTTAPAIMFHYFALSTRLATVSVTPIVLSPSPVAPAATSEVSMRTVSAIITGISAGHTTLPDNAIPDVVLYQHIHHIFAKTREE